MQLFRLTSPGDQTGERVARTWLVLADTLGEALPLVPDGCALETAVACPDRGTGRARVIGWMGPPMHHRRPVGAAE